MKRYLSYGNTDVDTLFAQRVQHFPTYTLEDAHTTQHYNVSDALVHATPNVQQALLQVVNDTLYGNHSFIVGHLRNAVCHYDM